MVVTLYDVLKLPSMRGAKVVAGHNSLGRTVNAVSVLESINTDKLGFDFPGFSNNLGQEIMLTGFIEYKDDVEAQCRSLYRIRQEGELGLILYYVGSIMPQVDQRLIDVANELDMPIIVMPEGRLELRYSDVIGEIMEAILEDRRANTYFASEVIEQLSHLAEPLRTVNSVLYRLRDRTQCSIYLLDESQRVLNAAEWPARSDLPNAHLIEWFLASEAEPGRVYEKTLDGQKYQFGLEYIHNNGSELTLVITNEKDGLTVDWCKQIKYVLKTYINLWTENYGLVDNKQLVNAIINGEQEKTRRLAAALKLNLSNWFYIYFFHHRNNSHDFPMLKAAKELITARFGRQHNSLLIDIFDETVIVFVAKPLLAADLNELLQELEQNGLSFGVLTNKTASLIQNVKDFYWLFQNYKKYINIIYPYTRVVSVGELEYIKYAKSAFDQHPEQATLAYDLLAQSFTEKQQEELIHTAEVFLLDAGCSAAVTAQLMYVHQSTVKYRLKLIETALGHKLTKMPEVFDLYLTAVLRRLDRAI